MDQRCDVFRGDECVIRGASLQQAAKLLNIDMFELAHPPRANERWNTCLGQFRVQVGHAHDLIAEVFDE
jgi:hypothetical protein